MIPEYFHTAVLFAAIVLLAVVILLWIRLSKRKAETEKDDAFTGLFEQQPEAWVILDGITLKAIKANQKAMNLFGVFREHFLGRLSFDKIFEEDLSADEVALLLNAVDNNTFVNKGINCRSLNGRIFKMNVSISRVNKGNLFCRFSDPLVHAVPIGTQAESSASFQLNLPEPEPEQSPAEADLKPETGQAENRNENREVDLPEMAFPVQLMNTSPDAVVFVQDDHQIIEANDAFSALTGYTIQELKSLRFDQLIHPSQAGIHEEWFSLLSNGKSKVSRSERQIIRKDGKMAFLELLGAGLPSKQAVILTAIDVSQARENQSLLMRNRENLLALVENTGECVFSLDALGKITILNNRYKDLFLQNYSVDLKEGMFFEDQLNQEEKKIFKERFRTVLQGQTVNYREAWRDASGASCVFEAFLYPVKDESGLITGMTYSGRDITNRLQQEEALREARDKAEQATLAKSEFLAVMSHEIRTPLNGLIGISELLNNTNLNQQQKEFVDIIRLSGEALLQVISDILDFSKIEANKMQLESAPFHVEDAATETMTILSGKAREKGIALRIEKEEGLPEIIYGDKARLRQVLMNLVGNSLKFTEKGSVTIGIRKSGEEEHKQLIEFAVRDTGIGIEPEYAAKLFSAFTQADPSTYRKYGGTGLGLTICKTLINIMGGDIWVESKVGEGSTFYFTIKADIASGPVEKQLALAKEQEVSVLAASREAGLDFAIQYPVSILLADDNDINRLLGRKLFERLGYTIETVSDGRQAYELIAQKDFDLVFMDVQMPEWDGLEATRRIRADFPSSRQPVIIAMTAFAGQEDKEACIDAGMDDYISKPIMMGDLEQVIVKFTPERRLEQKQKSEQMKNTVKNTERALLDATAVQRLLNIGKQTDPGFLQQVLEMFMKQAPENIKEIFDCLDRGDFTGMWKTAHKLKGTSLNIGAARMADICREIEKKGRNLETAGLMGLAMQLESDYRSTLSELKAMFQYN